MDTLDVLFIDDEPITAVDVDAYAPANMGVAAGGTLYLTPALAREQRWREAEQLLAARQGREPRPWVRAAR